MPTEGKVKEFLIGERGRILAPYTAMITKLEEAVNASSEKRRKAFERATAWRTARTSKKDFIAIDIMRAYNNNQADVGSEDFEIKALNSLENDLLIFLCGYSVSLDPVGKKRADRLGKALEGGLTTSQVDERARHIYKFINKKMTATQVREFALCTKVTMNRMSRLTKRCIQEKSPSGQWAWNYKDELCSKITPRMPFTKEYGNFILADLVDNTPVRQRSKKAK